MLPSPTQTQGHKGDSVEIAACLGTSLASDEAIAGFAEALAGQTECDYRAFLVAITSGRITARAPT
ncbi:MAG: hypothetical protein ACRDHP_02400 [Ktedonobacterales bacterium]